MSSLKINPAAELAAINAAIKELEAQRTVLTREAQDAAFAAWKAIRKTLEWKVEWKGPYTLRVSCHADAAYRAAIDDHKARFGTMPSCDEYERWVGMEYYLIGNVMVSTGGGHVVLRLSKKKDDDWFDRGPVELTAKQAQAFRDGIVPEELKSWGKEKS